MHTTAKLSLGILILPLLLSLVGCGLVRISPTNTPTPLTKRALGDGWSSYKNSNLGLSFSYPKELRLLLDKPDTSGIQLESDDVVLLLIANPLTQKSVTEYIASLREGGFIESKRDTISKGSWTGLRAQGNTLSEGYRFPQVIWLVNSGNSLLAVTATWLNELVDYVLLNRIWDSLEISGASFSLSSELISNGFTALNSPNGKYSLGYPTSWQATFYGTDGNYLVIRDLDDSDAFVFSVLSIPREGKDLGHGVQQYIDLVKAGFTDVRLNSDVLEFVNGSESARRVEGSLRFKDGPQGKYVAVIAATRTEIYTVSVVYELAKETHLLKTLNEIFERVSLAI